MTEEFRTVYEGGTGEITEKKSRFIATVQPVATEEEALSFIERTKKKYWDASHNCFAYILGENSEIKRCSDDGEPAKTAGKPMLDILEGEGLGNTAAVVTRYFGGTLLGTGGLIRAYQAAVKEALKNCTIINKLRGNKLKIITDYNGLGKLQYISAQMGIAVLETEYTEIVSITYVIPIKSVHEFEDKVTEATNGTVKIENLQSVYFSNLSGNILIF